MSNTNETPNNPENKSMVSFKESIKKNYKVLGIILGVVIIFGGMFTYKSLQNKTHNIANNKGEQYFYAADFDNAVKEYEDYFNKDKNPLWKAKIAQVYSIKGDKENSAKYLEEAKSVDKLDPETINVIAFTEYMNDDYELALEDGEKGLESFPKDKQLNKTMFAVYMANKNIDNAKKLLETYPIDEESPYDIAEKSRMFMLLGEKEKGFQELKKAWDKDKDEFKVYDVLSQIALYDRNSLLEDIDNLIIENPNEPAYKMWMAKLYSANKETALDAENIIKEIEGQDIGKLEKQVILSSIYSNSGKIEEADKIIEDVLKNYKKDYRAYHIASWHFLEKKDLKKAEEYAKESMYLNPNYPDNYAFLMPEILKQKNKSIEGEPYFRTAMLMEPYNYNIMLNIADYYWETTDSNKKALEYFELAEIVRPNDPEIKYNITLIYVANKQDGEAVQVLRQAIKLDDENPKYHRTLGTIYFLNGRDKLAIEETRLAFEADNKDILTLNNAGCYYVMTASNIQRGVYNLKEAYDGIKDDTDEYTRRTIKENYQKAKELLDQYKNAKGNSKLQVPELIMFY